MRYEVIEDQMNPGDWRAEAIDEEGEGEIYVAIFTGPDAQARADEYASWKSSADSRPLAETARR